MAQFFNFRNGKWVPVTQAPVLKQAAQIDLGGRKVTLQRGSVRKAGGRFAFRGRGAKSLRDDPEYTKHQRLAADLGKTAAQLTVVEQTNTI